MWRLAKGKRFPGSGFGTDFNFCRLAGWLMQILCLLRVMEKESSGPRRVCIGGISGGIGAALAGRLRNSGVDVCGVARASERLDTFREQHPDIQVAEADFTNSEAVTAAIQDVAGEGLRGYVHAVGSIFLKPSHMMSDAEWDQVLATNLSSAFYACRAVLGMMRRQKGGSIVLFSSVAARIGLGNHEAIAAAKGGIEGMVRAMAATNASLGIRVNGIAPGLVDTPAAAAMTSNANVRAFSERMHPLGRLGEADEVASLAAWMLSEEASWMTGEVISLDGGMGSVLPKPRG